MRILLAEDDLRIRQEIADSLKEAGYVVDCAINGEEIHFLGDTEDFAACILDLNLPQLDGLSILRQWRASGRNLPVLVLTARGSWPQRVEGIDAGADDYLPKPFAMEELLARLRAVIRRHGGHASTMLQSGEIALDTRQMRVAGPSRCRRRNTDLSPTSCTTADAWFRSRSWRSSCSRSTMSARQTL